MLSIERLDHIVLTVKDIEATCAFYCQALGMQVVTFDQDRKALVFGQQKINLHQVGAEFEPKAENPTAGSADLCFITHVPLRDAVEHLSSCGIEIIGGPEKKVGAIGTIESVYFRDPDLNLIELSVYS